MNIERSPEVKFVSTALMLSVMLGSVACSESARNADMTSVVITEGMILTPDALQQVTGEEASIEEPSFSESDIVSPSEVVTSQPETSVEPPKEPETASQPAELITETSVEVPNEPVSTPETSSDQPPTPEVEPNSPEVESMLAGIRHPEVSTTWEIIRGGEIVLNADKVIVRSGSEGNSFSTAQVSPSTDTFTNAIRETIDGKVYICGSSPDEGNEGLSVLCVNIEEQTTPDAVQIKTTDGKIINYQDAEAQGLLNPEWVSVSQVNEHGYGEFYSDPNTPETIGEWRK